MGSSSSNNPNKEEKKTENKETIDLTPEQIHQIMVENANLQDEVNNLKKEITSLKNNLANYEKIAQGKIQNINLAATKNLAQAYERIIFLETQNNLLITERNNLQQSWNSLNVENQRLKFYCYKMQIMLLNQMQKTPMNDNIRAAQNINTPQDNINMNNVNNNMNQIMNINSPSFNYQKNKNMITIVFNIDNKLKCNITTLPNHKLGNIFILALYQNGYSNFVNIKDFTFRYSTQNITNLFHENKEVKCINFIANTCPVIDVSGNLF